MAQFFNEKAKMLTEDYERLPCGKFHDIRLDELTPNLAKFSMEVRLRDCVIDTDGIRMVQGGVIPIIVDFAGVYLARMRSESQFIPKLARLEEDYLRPVMLGQDQKIIVRAVIGQIVDRKILVHVIVQNEKGENKGAARLLFIERKGFR